MLRAISLENFQGFKNPQRIELAPITLIFGANASGKSSFGRALRLLHQTSGFATYSRTPGLIFNGDIIDLNSFASTVHGQFRAEGNSEFIRVGLCFDLVGRMWDRNAPVIKKIEYAITDTRDRESQTSQHLKLDYKIHFIEEIWKDIGSPFLELQFDGKDKHLKFKGTPKERQASYQVAEKFFALTKSVSTDGQEFEEMGYLERPKLESSWPELLKKISIDPLGSTLLLRQQSSEELQVGEKQRFHFLAEMMQIIRFGIFNSFNNIAYIEPIRKIPGRVELAGEGHRLIKGNLETLNHWVGEITDKRYAIGVDQFEVPQSPHKVLTNFVRDNWTEAVVSFDEVGTGLSQVLPVLSAIFPVTAKDFPDGRARHIRKTDHTVIIEQPEIHLHPKAQSDMADAFIAAIKSESVRLQIIAETHSENILLRLQKRIREGVIPAEAVAVIFTEGVNDGHYSGNRAFNINMSENGDVLDPFPVSFADLRIQDIL